MSLFERIGIPGPRPNLIFGNSIDIAKESSYHLFPKWTKLYGPIVGFYIGGQPQVLITDFDLIRQVMIKDFHLFQGRNKLIPGGLHPQPQLQHAIIWVKGHVWRQLRSAMTPSFSIYKLNAMEQLMKSSIENMIKELDEKVKTGIEFNIKPIAEELTFSIATKCILGLNLSLRSMSEDTQSFLKTVRPKMEKSLLAMAMLLFPSLSFIVYPLRVWWETFRLKMLWSPEGVCYDILKKVLKVRKSVDTKSKDLLQLLMDSEIIRSSNENTLEMSSDDVLDNNSTMANDLTSGRLSDDEIISNVNIFLLAAFETSSVTIQFTLHNLVNNQDVQEQLRNDLKQAIIHNDGKANFKTISKVPLLSHVIKETLRMYPVASPATARVAEENYIYQGFQIPKGAGVFVGVTSIHNDPKLWPEPEKFKPQRFEQEFDKLAFLSFGAG